MAYTPYYSGGWQSGETGGTPITPAALNNIESGISAAIRGTGSISNDTLGSYKNTTTDWENTGITITVPQGHAYIGLLSQGFSSGKPVGIGINASSTLSGNIPGQSNENANGVYSSIVFLTSGTWYVFTKRATAATTNNSYYFRHIDFDFS